MQNNCGAVIIVTKALVLVLFIFILFIYSSVIYVTNFISE